MRHLLGVYVGRVVPVGYSEVVDIRRVDARGAIVVVFDVGANVGRKAMRYAKEFRGARVYAFEPFPDSYSALCRQTRRVDRIEPVQLAIGEARGVRIVPALDGPSEANSLKEELNRPVTEKTVEVQVETVDGFCMERGIEQIDLLKTDTEGCDLEVLQGASRMLKDRSIRFVYSEVGFASDDERHTPFQQVHALLQSCQYYFMGLYEVRQRQARYEFGNALFARKEEGES